MQADHTGNCCHAEHQGRKRLNKLTFAAAGMGAIFIMSFFLPALHAFRHAFLEYLKIVWWAVTLGLLIGGVIDRYVPAEYVSKMLSRPGRGTIFNAVFVGFFLSACSHGILAIVMELYRKGASVSAVASLLLASPWANLPFTLLLLGFFGPRAAGGIILGALVIALITGFIFQALDRKGWIERNPHTALVDYGFSIRRDIRRRWRARGNGVFRVQQDIPAILRASGVLGRMILGWVVVGMGFASLAAAYVPPAFFDRFMGPTVAGLLITLAAATVIEICSEGSAPLAFEIYRQTGAVGNSFVFLMGGVATDYTEVGLIWHNIGRRAALWLLAVSIPQILILGWLANRIF